MEGLDLKWVCVDKNDAEFDSASDSFNLDWESAGAVKRFSIVSNSVSFSVDLETGVFSKSTADEVEEIKGGLKGDLGDYSLVFFKRNSVMFDDNRNMVGHTKCYFIGYKKNGVEKLLKVSLQDNNLVAEFAER
jgi:hypothetical protein